MKTTFPINVVKTIFPATLLCDFYKLSHKPQYPKGTQGVYTTWIPRGSRMKGVDKVVNFDVQGVVNKYFVQYFNTHFFMRPKDEVIAEFERYLKYALGIENPDSSHIAALHDLGYLPLEVKALKEGTLVPLRVPSVTIENTHKDFYWLTNYVETIFSAENWQSSTNATIAFEYRKTLEKWAKKTGANAADVDFQAHDFSMRGMTSLESAAKSAAAHLLSFTGTDTIPGIAYLEEYYGANIEEELVGASIPATEHSVMCANSDPEERDEFESFKRLITEVYPKGFVSIVSDTYDFWKVVGDVLPRLKDDIMARDGRVVIRPDSGDPVDILCGKYVQEFESAEDAEEYFKDICREEAGKHCGDGCTGDDSYEYLYKVEDEYYKIILEPFYNRHDKRYYYVDGFDYTYHKNHAMKWEDLGLIESLWNIFGGTVNEKGYKVLDPHIGAIYGDSITLERTENIMKKLEKKGFVSTSVVLGIGSFTYQYNTRDVFYWAMKATNVIIDNKEKMIMKDPKTDNGTKKSLKGRVIVFEKDDGELTVMDGLNWEEQYHFKHIDKLETVFRNGKQTRFETLSEVRTKLKSYL